MLKKLLAYKSLAIVCLLATIVSLIAVGHWFWGDKILYFWDAYLPFDPRVSFEKLYYSWYEGLFPGFPATGWSWFFYWIIFFVPYYFFHSLSISEMFTYVFLLTLSIVNFYLLARYVLLLVFGESNKKFLLQLVAFISAFLFTFNLYTFYNFYFMFNPGAFVLTFLPLNLLALFHIYPLDKHNGIKNKGRWTFLFFASIIFMSPGFGIYVFFLQYLIWLAVYLLLFFLFSRRKILSLLTLELITFYVSMFALNLWWFLPAYLNIQFSYAAQSSFGTTIWFDKGFTPLALLNSLRFLGSALMVNNSFSWTSLYLENQSFTLPLFVFAFTLIASLIFLVKKKISILLTFLLGVMLVSLFIVKFTTPPASFLLWFAFHYVPFFGAFRDTFQKAGIFYTLPYFIFISIGLMFLLREFWRGKVKIFAFAFVILFIVAAIVLSGPFFLMFKDNIREMHFTYNKKAYVFSAKTQVPPEYISLKKYLEGKCDGETIIEVPRSGFITDGVWEKYNASYVGQDMLPGLVSCNFLSTATFNTASEQAIEVPYILLERDDFQSFKNYLNQNNINYVLVRHDFIPQGYITWAYVDPTKTERELSADKDFSPIFKNDFFTLFKKSDLRKNQYGFGLTKETIYLHSKIQSPDDYAAISQVIGDLQQPVLLSLKNNQFKTPKTPFIISANCIGCLKIASDSVLQGSPQGLLQNAKNFIKILLRMPVDKSSETIISLNILATNNTFNELMENINSENQKNVELLLDLYKKEWQEIDKEIINLNSDKFSKNNKYIEANKFLTVQKNTIFNLFTEEIFRINRFLNKSDNKRMFSELVIYQKELEAKFSKNILQTDLNNNTYAFRLDVPSDDEYVCRVIQRNGGATVNSVILGDINLNRSEFNGESPVFLKKGTYLLSISYEIKKIMNEQNIAFRTEEFTPIELGFLKTGKYKVSFDLAPGLNGKALIFVTKDTTSLQTLLKAGLSNNPDENVKSSDAIGLIYGNSVNYKKDFDVQTQDEGNYYLYLYFLDLNKTDVNIENLQLEGAVSDTFFSFLCTGGMAIATSGAELNVEKINPTHYLITIPKNYNGFLTFNQSYDDNWTARFEGTNSMLPHIQSGYSNAWYIDKNNDGNKIVIEYRLQKAIEKGGVIAVILSIFSLALYLTINRLRKSD